MYKIHHQISSGFIRELMVGDIPFRKDQNTHGGGILVFIREDIPSREGPTIEGFSDLEGIFVEINLRKSKCNIQTTLSFERTLFFSNQ